jgi:hypothetical protein
MPVNVDDFETPESPDFRRANGAPMIVDKNGKNVRLSRPSSWGKVLDDENALTNWKIDRAAQGVANDKALQARYIAVKEDDRNTFKTLRELAINAGKGEQSADIGTALHAMSVRWEDPDDDFQPPEEYAKSLRVYSKVLAEHGLVSEMMEYQCVNLEMGCAGTADRLYRTTRPIVTPDGEYIPEGTLFVGDLKTGKKLDFSLPGYTVQMALYADGELYDVVRDEFRPTPKINKDWGILVHLPADQETCTLIWVDLGVGKLGADLVAAVKEWRRNWKNVAAYGAYEFGPPPPDGAGLLVAELGAEPIVDFIRSRMKAIAEHAEAKAALMKHWPEGVPSPKQGLTDMDQINQVISLLDDVEAEYGLEWPSGDPRPSETHTKKAGK